MSPSVAVPTHILKIELHPAELGMVTASLRLAGEQLSIELKPETHEAYRRLATDSDAIVKSMEFYVPLVAGPNKIGGTTGDFFGATWSKSVGQRARSLSCSSSGAGR